MAVGLLQQMGYTHARHYHGGIADWQESGLPIETAAAASVGSLEAPSPIPTPGESIAEPARGAARRITLGYGHRWGGAVLDMVEGLSAAQIFLVWLGVVLSCGVIYWLAGFAGHPGLVDAGRPVGGNLRGLLSAIYFSFVTTTSVGYGDVLPLGAARVLSIFEAVTGLLIFGALVAKFVSRRQDELVRDIYNVTFETRLDRVQTNLHLVLSELQSIASLCDEGIRQPERVGARLESAVLVFGGELRAIHSLLYSPQRAPEETVLEAILVALHSALRTLSDLVICIPPEFTGSATFAAALRNIRLLAEDICAECVPQVYAPGLATWMDRVQQTARKIV